MKNLILSAVAILAFGVASAQTDPKTPPTAQTPQAPVVTPAKEKSETDANMQNQVPESSEQRKQMDGAQPRKDELKTRDHVKSTPDPETVKSDTDKNTQTTKKSKRKKSS